MIAGVILWFVVPVCFFIAGIAYLVHRKRKHERWLRQRHEIILARAAIQSERWDRQILLEQRTAIVDEEVLPIHPLSSHPFDRQETATQDRRDVLSKVIPSGVSLLEWDRLYSTILRVVSSTNASFPPGRLEDVRRGGSGRFSRH